jgi:cytochrome o ubiquinol oxidase subunit 2
LQIAAFVRATVLLPLLALAGCGMDVLEPHGAIGAADATILIDSVAIMLAIVLPTIAAIFAFAFWFRKSNTRARYLPNWEFSGQIEMVTWSIPTLTIILLGGVSWIGSHQLDPAQPLKSKSPPLEVQVVSLDWKWLFIYPAQKVASVNQLAIPAGVPVHFSLTSASVMNVFFVPQLGSMIYTMNGMQTQLYLIADTPGTFHGESANLSGAGFSDMHFDVQALPPDRFAAWIEAARKAGPTLDKAAYTALEVQSTNVQPFTYRAADPGLFAQIVSQVVPPGPGPADPTADVKPSTRAER